MQDQPQMRATASGEAEPARTRVFLSYSRKDGDFTRCLAEARAHGGYAPDFDQSARDPANIDTGISAEDEWWRRLQQMIAAADVMVFIVSPDSAASKVCDEEIAYARNVGKRIIPILRRPIDFAKAPPRLSALNVKIDFSDDGEAALVAALAQLCAALDLDVAWHRESRRLVGLALKWDAESRPADRVMSPADIRASERLLERRPRSADPPAQVLTDFLEASRTRLEEEMRRLRRTTGRAFVKPAEEALREGRHEQALRLCAAGAQLADDFDLELVTELRSPAASTIFDNRILAVLKEHSNVVSVTVFSPDGRRIVTASHDGTARIWDAAIGKQIAALQGHSGPVWSAAFSPDGRQIVTASEDCTARIWDAETGKEITALREHTHPVLTASFSTDGRRIATASADYRARLWDAATGKEIAALQGHSGPVWSTAFSPDGRQIVTASEDRTARIWDAATGKEITALQGQGHTNRVRRATFSPDGRRVVTASEDNTARIWDAATGKQIAALEGHTDWVRSAAFSPDGRQIVTVSKDRTARTWDAPTGRQGSPVNVMSAALSPDGERIVAVSTDNTARLWDAATGKEIAPLQGHTSTVNSAAFSPDGRRIVTESADGPARLWDVSRSETIALSLPIALIGALAHGVGRRIETERTDLLMQDAEDDLLAAALK